MTIRVERIPSTSACREVDDNSYGNDDVVVVVMIGCDYDHDTENYGVNDNNDANDGDMVS